MLKITKEMEMQSPYHHLNLGVQLQKESQMLIGRSLQLSILFKGYESTSSGKQWMNVSGMYAQMAEVYEDEARKELDIFNEWFMKNK